MVCCWSDPLQPSESQWNHYLWEVCSANQWDALKTVMPAAGIGQQRAQFFSTTMPHHMSHNKCFKSWTIWAMKFWLTHHIHLTSHQTTTTSSSISTTFCRENAPIARRRQNMLLRIHRISKHGFLHYRNKPSYFLLAKMCWLQWFLVCLIQMYLSLIIMI